MAFSVPEGSLCASNIDGFEYNSELNTPDQEDCNTFCWPNHGELSTLADGTRFVLFQVCATMDAHVKLVTEQPQAEPVQTYCTHCDAPAGPAFKVSSYHVGIGVTNQVSFIVEEDAQISETHAKSWLTAGTIVDFTSCKVRVISEDNGSSPLAEPEVRDGFVDAVGQIFSVGYPYTIGIVETGVGCGPICTKNILHGKEMQTFWVSKHTDGTVAFGSGALVGESVVLSTVPGSNLDVTHFALATMRTSGRWVTFRPKNDKAMTLIVSQRARDSVEVSCFSLGGEQLASLTVIPTEKLWDLHKQFAVSLECTEQCLKLVLPDGRTTYQLKRMGGNDNMSVAEAFGLELAPKQARLDIYFWAGFFLFSAPWHGHGHGHDPHRRSLHGLGFFVGVALV